MLTVLDHPLAHDLLAGLRDRDTDVQTFRDRSRVLTTLLAVEATRGLRTKAVKIQTPLEETEVRVIDPGLGAVPILRAGMAMLEPVLEIFRDVKVGYIGLERHHDTAIAHRYYAKLPDFTGRYVLCLDPMLATGGSASQAISIIKGKGAESVVMVSVVAAPQGVEKVRTDHPDVPIVTAALDRDLNDLKYILPGLGDYGDRLYGTF